MWNAPRRGSLQFAPSCCWLQMSPLNLVKSWFSRNEQTATSDKLLNSWSIVYAIQMIFQSKCWQTVLMKVAKLINFEKLCRLRVPCSPSSFCYYKSTGKKQPVAVGQWLLYFRELVGIQGRSGTICTEASRFEGRSREEKRSQMAMVTDPPLEELQPWYIANLVLVGI